MLKKYLYSTFSQLFFPLFFVLLFIASIVLLITIASRTLVVKMSLFDLLHYFSFSLPGIVVFIVPLTLLIALVLALSRLSYEYELLVFFSLGVRPGDLIRAFLPIIALSSATLLVFGLCLVPIANSAANNYLAKRQSDIDVNLKSGELGQKIGDWLVYVNQKEGRVYRDLVLFSKNGLRGEESLILAKEGSTQNENGQFMMRLDAGAAYFAQADELKKMEYERMLLREGVGAPTLQSYDLVEYWKGAFSGAKGKKRRFCNAVLTALFPILSIFLVPLFGVANPRFSNNKSLALVIGACSLYFLAVHIFSENAPFTGLILLPPVWFFGSFWLYRRVIARYY